MIFRITFVRIHVESNSCSGRTRSRESKTQSSIRLRKRFEFLAWKPRNRRSDPYTRNYPFFEILNVLSPIEYSLLMLDESWTKDSKFSIIFGTRSTLAIFVVVTSEEITARKYSNDLLKFLRRIIVEQPKFVAKPMPPILYTDDFKKIPSVRPCLFVSSLFSPKPLDRFQPNFACLLLYPQGAF